jgi:hypothetical protein
MKKLTISILVLVSIFLLCAAKANQNDISTAQKNSIEGEILKVQVEMKTAAEKLDADTLYKYVLDTNNVIIENGVLRSTRKNAYDTTKQGFQGIKELSYTYNHTNINVISPTTALWTGSGTSTATLTDGRKLTIDFAETIVFVMRESQWKVFHAHRSSTTAN